VKLDLTHCHVTDTVHANISVCDCRGVCCQAAVLDSLKTVQEKYNVRDSLRNTVSLIENLYKQHDELDPDDLGDVLDTSDESSVGDDDDDGDDNINLDEISDDSGHLIVFDHCRIIINNNNRIIFLHLTVVLI